MQEFRYCAFISYKHTDKAWAVWLQRKLESFRLPAKICKQHSLPKKLPAVFRDESDLPAGALHDNLHAALSESKFLIVICSRALAQSSKYVDFEVEAFKALGRGDNIIPFIVDGEPHAADPANECFPLSLINSSVELLGANAAKYGKRNAFIRTVSCILGITFDDLMRRENRRRNRKRIFAGAAAALILIACGLLHDYYAPKTRYYSDYVLSWGRPVGIGELSREQIKSMNTHYAIISSRGKVIELRHENSAGVLRDHSSVPFGEIVYADRPTRAVYKDDGGNLEVTYYNANNAQVMVLDYSKDLTTVDIFSSLERKTPYSPMHTTMFGLESVNTITRYVHEYNLETGFINETHYQHLHTPVADEQGVYGVRYTERDVFGRELKARYLSYENKEFILSPNAFGIIGIDRKYISEFGKDAHQFKYVVDEHGNTAVPELFGIGWASCTYEYDNFNIVKTRLDYAKQISYIDILNSNNQDDRTHTISKEPHIFVKNEWNKVVKAQITFAENPYNLVKSKFDKNGFELERSFHIEYDDMTSVAALDEFGCARYVYQPDRRGNVEFTTCHDIIGDTAPCYDNWTIMRRVYENDRIIKINYLDKSFNPVSVKEGYTGLSYCYSPDSRVNSVTFIDSLTGISSVVWEYGDNFLTERYFDAQNNPTRNEAGIAGIYFHLLLDGSIDREEYFDEDGNRILCNDNYAQIKYDYDDFGRRTTYTFYGLDDNEYIINSAGYTRKDCSFDDLGRLEQVRIYGINENLEFILVNDINGYSRTTMRYDSFGNLIRMEYEAVNEFGDYIPTLDRNFLHSLYLAEYTSDGRLLSEDTYGLDEDGDGKLDHVTVEGYARYTAEYYDNANLKLETYYVADASNGSNLVMYKRVEYDYNGTMPKVSFYGDDANNDGNPDLLKVEEYEDNLNIIKVSYFGIDADNDGYPDLEQIDEYDENGNPVRVTLYGVDADNDGNPDVKQIDEYYGIIKKVSLYGADMDNNGKQDLLQTNEYDDNGRLIKTSLYGVAADNDGEPDLLQMQEYDGNGNLVKLSTFHSDVDNDGKPDPLYIEEFDARGSLIKSSFYIINADNDGDSYLDMIMKAKFEYDNFGNISKDRYFVLNKDSMWIDLIYDGVAAGVIEYNENGDIVFLSFYGLDNNADGYLDPILVDGYSRFVAKYDNIGDVIMYAFYGLDEDDDGLLDPIEVEGMDDYKAYYLFDIPVGNHELTDDERCISDRLVY